MCLSCLQSLTPRRSQVDCPWPSPCLKPCASMSPQKANTKLGQPGKSLSQPGSLRLCEECVPTMSILLKLAERQQALLCYLIVHPQPQTVGIQQTFLQSKPREPPERPSKRETILLNDVCPMLFRFRGETPA